MSENKETTEKKAAAPKAEVAKAAPSAEKKSTSSKVAAPKATAPKKEEGKSKPAPAKKVALKKASAKKPAANSQCAQACGRLIRTSPQKLGLLAELIRGKKIEKALVDLTFSKKRVSSEVKKVLQSAVANAENNYNMDIDRLYVSEAFVGKSITMKRFHARAKGRGNQIKKMFSNITIIVREDEEKV